MTSFPELLPHPRRIVPHDGSFALPATLGVTAPDELSGPPSPALDALGDALSAHGLTMRRSTDGGGALALRREPSSGTGSIGSMGPIETEGFRLRVAPDGIELVARDPAGLDYGLHALAQLVRGHGASGALPALEIEDAPALRERGAMLDVSRDRVPTMETLFQLVDQFASWRLNRLQLYTEHTFAYRGREEVWGASSAITPDEVRTLVHYATERHIEVVPNQQCFGHMHRWLVHGTYRDLAECPDGVEHPFLPADPAASAREREPFSLCPTDPRSLAFVGELLDELLPHFRSEHVNVGCDETFDIGEGRSRDACEARGVPAIYAEYLDALARLVDARGKRMQFWADIVLAHPELVRDLPEGVVPMLWGYEADHPFERETAALAESGRAFHVCPGTSSWQSIGGRLANMTGNVEGAVRHAVSAGALGILVTDWGDRGHLQPLTTSYPGWMTAADLAWNPEAPSARRTPDGLADLMNRHVLGDPSGNAGRAAIALARAGEATGARIPNASPLSALLTNPGEPCPPPRVEGLTDAGLEHADALCASALETLRGESMRAKDRDLLRAELAFAGELSRFLCRLGLERLDAGPHPALEALPSATRTSLAAKLAPLAAEHRRLWLVRSRPGGLEDSAAWLEGPLRRLRS